MSAICLIRHAVGFFLGIRVNKTVLPGGSGCVKCVALLSFLGSLGVNYLDAELLGALGTTDCRINETKNELLGLARVLQFVATFNTTKFLNLSDHHENDVVTI